MKNTLPCVPPEDFPSMAAWMMAMGMFNPNLEWADDIPEKDWESIYEIALENLKAKGYEYP